MNGIIIQGSEGYIGCSAKFLFKPDFNETCTPAIAEFNTGEKAYSEIIEVFANGAIVRIGEYYAPNGSKVNEQIWRLSYNQKKDVWKIIENITPE